MTFGHENLPANLTEKERGLAELKAIEREKGTNNETGRENSESTVKEVREAAMSADAEVKKVSLEGGNKKENFAGDVAKKLNIPPEAVGDAIKSQEKSLERNQEEKDGILGKFGKGLEAIVLATSLGVGGAGVSGTAKALEMGFEADGVRRMAEANIPSNPLEKMLSKATPETQADAVKRIGLSISSAEKGKEGSAEQLTERLKAETEDLQRKLEEQGGESVNGMQTEIGAKSKRKKEKERIAAEEKERMKIESEVFPELLGVEDPNDVMRLLVERAKKDGFETNIISRERLDGQFRVGIAKVHENRIGGNLGSKVGGRILDFYKDPDTKAIYIDHNHPSEVLVKYNQSCNSCLADTTTMENMRNQLNPPASAGDMLNPMLIQELLKKGLKPGNPQVKVFNRVATPHGYFEFSVSDSGAFGVENGSGGIDVKRMEKYQDEQLKVLANDSSLQKFIEKLKREEPNIHILFVPSKNIKEKPDQWNREDR